MNSKQVMKAIVFASIIGICGISSAAILSPGDIVVSSLGELTADGDGVIFKINPITGDRSIISGPGVGTGPGFDPYGVSVASLQDLYVAQHASGTASVHHVDVATGNRQVISSSTVGTGPVLQSAFDMIVRGDGKLVVADAWGGTLVLVDPITLERVVVTGPGIGTGPDLLTPIGMTLDTNGDILVTTVAPFDQPSTLFRVDALTGDREIVSASDVGNGPVPDSWSDVAIHSNGQALLTSFQGQIRGVLSIDQVTGDRVIVSTLGIGVGPNLLQPRGITIEADGQVIVSNAGPSGDDSLIRIDPATGDRTTVSGVGVGSGPLLQNPQYLDIVPVPEPSSMILFISGVLLVLVARWQRVVSVDNALPRR